MAFPCPRCGDRYTQSLPMVYSTGTSVRKWRSRSGYSGNTVSQNIIGSLASLPEKKPVFKLCFWLLIVLFFFSWPFASQVDRFSINNLPNRPAPIVDGLKAPHHRRRAVMTQPAMPMEQNNQLLAIPAIIGAGISILLIWRLVRAVRFNRSVYPIQLREWQLSFMCRGCGALFRAPDAEDIVISG